MKTAKRSMQLPEDSVVISIKNMLEDVAPVSSERCIYKVPASIRKVNEEAYTPQVVSIGPLHRGREGLKAMELQKLRYLQSLHTRACLGMEEIVKCLRKREEEVRNCYSETVELCSDELVEMILLDGCFIVELLLRAYDKKYIKDEDPVYSKPHMSAGVWFDLILLENQLPLFVLSDIYNLIPCSRPERLPSVDDLIRRFVINITGLHRPDINSFRSALHLVDCLRMYYLPDTPSGPKDKVMKSFSPSVTRLHEAGVKFEKMQSNCILDLWFDKKLGVLKIPVLEIHDHTETILRNQIAFEQCHHEVRPIVQYTTFIDSIINTPADVDLLMDKEIITSIVGSSKSICELFNKLGRQASLGDEPLFFHLCQDLQDHCNARWNKWKAILKSQYFHTPWAVISFIAGITLLLLTVAQTVFSILGM